MAKIKWRPQDVKKISTAVRKFNAAITRLEKRNPELQGSGVLPERLNVAEVKGNILTRADFNRFVKKVDRFFRPGAQEITKAPSGYYETKWARKERQYLQKRINAQRKAVTKKYSIGKENAKFLGVNPVDLDLEQKRIFDKASKATDPEDAQNILQEWFNLMYTVERESSSEYYDSAFAKLRNAYFKAIKLHLEPDDAEELIKLLEDNDIWGSDIVYAVSVNDILDFDIFYDTSTMEERGKKLKARWEQYVPEVVSARKKTRKKQ